MKGSPERGLVLAELDVFLLCFSLFRRSVNGNISPDILVDTRSSGVPRKKGTMGATIPLWEGKAIVVTRWDKSFFKLRNITVLMSFFFHHLPAFHFPSPL